MTERAKATHEAPIKIESSELCVCDSTNARFLFGEGARVDIVRNKSTHTQEETLSADDLAHCWHTAHTANTMACAKPINLNSRDVGVARRATWRTRARARNCVRAHKRRLICAPVRAACLQRRSRKLRAFNVAWAAAKRPCERRLDRLRPLTLSLLLLLHFICVAVIVFALLG